MVNSDYPPLRLWLYTLLLLGVFIMGVGGLWLAGVDVWAFLA